MFRWTSLGFEVEQAEITVVNITTMMERNKSLRIFEIILNLSKLIKIVAAFVRLSSPDRQAQEEGRKAKEKITNPQ